MNKLVVVTDKPNAMADKDVNDIKRNIKINKDDRYEVLCLEVKDIYHRELITNNCK